MSEDNKPEDLASLHRRLDDLEHAVARRVEETCAAFFRTPQRAAGQVIPAWRRRTRGERRWQVAACTAVAIGLQVAVPGRLAVLRPVWILPALQGILLLALVLANPHRIDRQSRVLRTLGLTLAALISFANAWSLVNLAIGLVRGTEGENAGPLLVTGGAIWLTNVIVFGLWYWEFDRVDPSGVPSGLIRTRTSSSSKWPARSWHRRTGNPPSPTTSTWPSPTRRRSARPM
ncbi:MAG TPA: hypothetical protein VJ351_27770 [Streptosporangiaceae bacterium]|nr:hypothetical protein [Streptosporangiaceae bacterium]